MKEIDTGFDGIYVLEHVSNECDFSDQFDLHHTDGDIFDKH